MVETSSLANDPGFNPMADLIHRAVEGDRQAMRQLVTALTPVIRGSVQSVLSRVRVHGRREAVQEVEDVTQTVLLSLFADRGRVLLQWDPARGRDLEGFVELLAKHEVFSLLRSRRRSPWTEDPTLHEDLDMNPISRRSPESETISRDMVHALAHAVRDRLSPKGAQLFDMMFVNGTPVEEVCAATGLKPDAVYAWRSRISKQVREIVAELAKIPPSARPQPPPAEPRSTEPTRRLPAQPARPPAPSPARASGTERRGSATGLRIWGKKTPARESGTELRGSTTRHRDLRPELKGGIPPAPGSNTELRDGGSLEETSPGVDPRIPAPEETRIRADAQTVELEQTCPGLGPALTVPSTTSPELDETIPGLMPEDELGRKNLAG